MDEEIKKVEKGKYDSHKWEEFLESARERRDPDRIDNSYEKYKNEFIEFMKEYDIAMKENLDRSLKYYKNAITTEFFNENYITLNEKYLKHVLSRCKIMVITANPIEKAVLHHKIIESGSAIMTRILCVTTAYYVFEWGKYWIAHIHQSQSGAGKDLGANATISDALKYFTPNVIISLGIAFGIDYDTQNIGDVLVSRKIFPYSANKRDEDDIKPDRTQDKTIDDWLHVRLENAVGFLDGVTYGGILSGESVMSSFAEKDRICLGYTNADYVIGGEMEGNAVFQCAKRMGIPGVVIKGICDWGVAKNNIFDNDPAKEKDFKDSLQAFAMMQAVEKCNPLFNDKELFSLSPNIDVYKLKDRYHICLGLLVVSQILMAANGLQLLLYNKKIYIFELFGHFLNQALTWILIPFILFMLYVVVFAIRFIHKATWRVRIHHKMHRKKGTKNNQSDKISQS